MASINATHTVPDGAVPLVRRTLAAVLDIPVPSTAAEIKTAVEAYLHLRLKSDVLQQKQHEAQMAAMADDSDGSASW
jgi:hypothetical protein